MNTVITFTPAQLFAAFLGLCGAITAMGGAVGVIIKAVNASKKPEKDQNARITALEVRMGEIDRCLARDKRRLDDYDDNTKVIIQSLLALLSHGINGNDIDALKKAKTAIESYLVNRNLTL